MATHHTPYTTGNTRVGDRGARSLAQLLRVASTLKTLNVEGSCALTHVRHPSNDPQRLTHRCVHHCTDCGIGAHGIAGFADVLGGHRGWLQELGLTANPLGSDGAIALANMLATNTSLRRLELQGVRATALMLQSPSV